ATGEPVGFDFREMAPAAARPDMWLVNGEYDRVRHHNSHMAVGVPGTVAGLHMAWKAHGKMPWSRLVRPAIELANDGIVVTDGLARSLAYQIPRFEKYAASLAKFTNDGKPLVACEVWKQPDLAAALLRISEHGPAGFYEGKTADLIVEDMKKSGGIITHADLKSYDPLVRTPIRGTYRGHQIIGMPPPSSGGIAVVETLNILEGYDLTQSGFGSAENLHRYSEAMRRAFCDRAQHVGDPKWNPEMPIKRIVSKQYADTLRKTISPDRASKSSPSSFEWPAESNETTHLSVVDSERNAVALTYTLEYSYGSAIVVPGGGFLLNNEMGDFNPIPGTTNEVGYIGTKPNLAAPGKRMLSSMSPTIVVKDDKPFIVTGSPGGRTIINTTWQTIVNVVDFEMNAQQAVDAFRVHHQWLPDRLMYETHGPSPDSLKILRGMGHTLLANEVQGCAEVIVVRDNHLEGGYDHRRPDGSAAGY
ncbi:MAG: gamma-glutamyltransferase, partial [Planctomycetota bacterium]